MGGLGISLGGGVQAMCQPRGWGFGGISVLGGVIAIRSEGAEMDRDQLDGDGIYGRGPREAWAGLGAWGGASTRANRARLLFW